MGEEEEKVKRAGLFTLIPNKTDERVDERKTGTPLLSHLLGKQKPTVQEGCSSFTSSCFYLSLLPESEALNR